MNTQLIWNFRQWASLKKIVISAGWNGKLTGMKKPAKKLPRDVNEARF
jgi:hypothetical protein